MSYFKRLGVLTNAVNQSLMTFLLLTPSAFFGFQDLHDGYVLETSILFKNVFADSPFMPFSQYGPLWSSTLGSISLVTSPALLLISIRIFSIFCYALSIFLYVEIIRGIQNQAPSPIVSVFFVASWYFFGPYLGWPSTFILPLILFAIALFTHSLLNSKSRHIKSVLIGSMVALVQFGRIQVGSLLLLTFIFLFVLFGLKRCVLFLLIGYSGVVAMVFSALGRQHVFFDSLYDLIVFSFGFHLSVERGATRVPVWTLLIALFVITSIRVIRNSLSAKLSRAFVFCILLLITLSILVVLGELMFSSKVFDFLRWRLLQRLFVGVFLGLLLSCLLEFSLMLRAAKKGSSSNLRTAQINFALSLLALAVYSQNYPLFSSHHTWYSSLAILLPSYFLFRESVKFSSNSSRNLGGAIIMFLSLLMISTWVIQHSLDTVRAPGARLVWVSLGEYNNYSAKRTFLDENVSYGATLQNFCTDPTVFLLRPDVKPASRIFLWWEHFEDFSEYRDASRREADYALVCNDRLTVFKELFDQAEWVSFAKFEEGAMILFRKNI